MRRGALNALLSLGLGLIGSGAATIAAAVNGGEAAWRLLSGDAAPGRDWPLLALGIVVGVPSGYFLIGLIRLIPDALRMEVSDRPRLHLWFGQLEDDARDTATRRIRRGLRSLFGRTISLGRLPPPIAYTAEGGIAGSFAAWKQVQAELRGPVTLMWGRVTPEGRVELRLMLSTYQLGAHPISGMSDAFSLPLAKLDACAAVVAARIAAMNLVLPWAGRMIPAWRIADMFGGLGALERAAGDDDHLRGTILYTHALLTAAAAAAATYDDPETWRAAELRFQAALQAWPRDRFPAEWAAAQDGMARARFRAGAPADTVIAACRAALEERPRERVPFDWAITQHLLLRALHRGGRLHEAAEAGRALLQVLPHDAVPRHWAQAQEDLAAVLHRLGEAETGTQLLREAAAAYRAAAREWEILPERFAPVQMALGRACRTIAERDRDAEAMAEAAWAYRVATLTWSPDEDPEHWAEAKRELDACSAALEAMAPGRTG